MPQQEWMAQHWGSTLAWICAIGLCLAEVAIAAVVFLQVGKSRHGEQGKRRQSPRP